MKYTFFCQFAFIIYFISLTNTVTNAANGCGSKVTIDKYLEENAYSNLVPCCNEHDDCYDTCGRKKSDCDNQFRTCTVNACKKGEIVSNCVFAAAIMYTGVKVFGDEPYNESQAKCKHEIEFI